MGSDFSTSDLLCNEETRGLCFSDDDDLVERFNHGQSPRSDGGDSGETPYDLACLSEECIGWMLKREREHMPRHGYAERLRSGELDLSFRRWALDWMFKACGHYRYRESCLCSAMTYFDRFLSVYELSLLERVDRKWEIQLIAMACLSLAAKLEEANVLSNKTSQREEQSGFLFEWKTIQRMEILILNRLDWKIKAYTPCSFIDYYLTKINGGEFPSQAVIDRSLQVIISTIEGIEFLKFRASEIAAAVSVAVLVHGEESKDIDNVVSGLIGMEKGKVEKVVEMIRKLSTNGGIISGNYGPNNHSLTRGLRSTNGVLEAASCLTCKTGTVITGESCPKISSRNNKRRKLDQKPNLESGS